MLYELNSFIEEGAIPKVPVYLDSPLSIKASELFLEYSNKESAEISGRIDSNKLNCYNVVSAEDSRNLVTKKGPHIVITASGMCEAGRVLHHLRNNIEKPSTMILTVGFQAQNTLARRLAERRSPVRIFGEEFDLKAEVHVFDAFSAHADRDELLGWVRRLDRPPRQCFVVHGEEGQSLAFASALEGEGLANVVVPELGLEYRL